MVKAIIFDLWGTLVEQGVRSPVKQVRDILRIELPFSEYVVRLEHAMMTRPFDGLREAFLEVCREFAIEPREEELEQLVGMWNKSWMLAEPYEGVENVLKKLRENYLLILVSNTDCFSAQKVLEKFKLRELFDKIFLSCEIGLIKTDRQFFTGTLSQCGLQIDDCVMVGDSLQSDIMPAKRLGMRAVLIDRRQTRDFRPKIRELTELERAINEETLNTESDERSEE